MAMQASESIEKPPAICLMGPTAAGKTQFAMDLSDCFSSTLINVDSAQVYRGMDIGTGKPDATTRRRYPHRLMDIRDPSEIYSASQFRADAIQEMSDALVRGKTPVLVGGTMLYFRSCGMASLRCRMRALVFASKSKRWPQKVDGTLCMLNSKKRIRNPLPGFMLMTSALQRALEVFLSLENHCRRCTGRTMIRQNCPAVSTLWQSNPLTVPYYTTGLQSDSVECCRKA